MSNVIKILRALPWVKELHSTSGRCESVKYGELTSAEQNTYLFKDDKSSIPDDKWCHNTARWNYKPLKSSWMSGGKLCTVHVQSTIDMNEDRRIRKWLEKHKDALSETE